MNVLISTDGCPFNIEISRVVGLFFENPTLTFRAQGEVDSASVSAVDVDFAPHLSIHVALVIRGREYFARGQLWSSSGQSDIVREYSAEIEADSDKSEDHTSHMTDLQHPENRKFGKHVVLHVLYEALVEFTGEIQPWGYLTGIRPLKIVHRMKLQGMSDPDMRRRLQDQYLMLPDRADLALDIARRQLEVIPDLYHLHNEVSIYVGIPFCPTHCAYCTFPAYSMVDKATYVNDFLVSMAEELRHLGTLLRTFQIPVTSVYIGGGTPTSLRAFELELLLQLLEKEIPGRDSWRELTVEAGRPDTITPDRVRVMKAFGVDRISVNPQTFKAATLQHIRRGHTPDQVDHRFHHVRDAGFDNINMDMILGLPGEDIHDVRNTMERIERLNPDSVTVHTMALKRSAAVKNDRDTFQVPSDDVVRQMMRETKEWVARQGYVPYYVYRQMDILGNQENIGFARPGKESIYNICIMEERQTIIGIGGGAVTKAIGRDGKHFGRLANPREPKAYIDTVQSVIERKDKLLQSVFSSLHESPPQVPVQSCD